MGIEINLTEFAKENNLFLVGGVFDTMTGKDIVLLVNNYILCSQKDWIVKNILNNIDKYEKNVFLSFNGFCPKRFAPEKKPYEIKNFGRFIFKD